MARVAPRKKNSRPEPELDQTDAPPDMKHWAIMGSLVAGPPLLVLILFLALSGGKPEEANAGPATTPTQDLTKSRASSRRAAMEKQIAIRVQRLIGEAKILHQKAKRQTRRFYDLDDPKPKMAAFKEAEQILRKAQTKMEEATRVDRYRKHDSRIQDLKTVVDRDIHNIMKDKPIYLGD